MAMLEIVKTKAKFNNNALITVPTALGAEGGYINFSGEDSKTILIIDGATATINAGNGIQGTNSLVVPFTSGRSRVVVLESGKFVNTSGTNKGKVIITGAGATVEVIELP
ncbi:MAG: hypothetical protein RR497_07160 [Oscillospiraceae bacterium]